MSKSSESPETGLSVTELAQKYGRDRATIKKLLRGLPFKFGAKGAHLYDEEAASAAIESGTDNAREIMVERLKKVKAERELREIQLKEKLKDMVHTQLFLDFAAEMVVQLRQVTAEWPEYHRRKADIAIWRAGTLAWKSCGRDTAADERDCSSGEATWRGPESWRDTGILMGNRPTRESRPRLLPGIATLLHEG